MMVVFKSQKNNVLCILLMFELDQWECFVKFCVLLTIPAYLGCLVLYSTNYKFTIITGGTVQKMLCSTSGTSQGTLPTGLIPCDNVIRVFVYVCVFYVLYTNLIVASLITQRNRVCPCTSQYEFISSKPVPKLCRMIIS